MSQAGHSPLPRGPGDKSVDGLVRFAQQTSDVVNGIMRGRTNNQFAGTLTANAASSVFMNANIANDSTVMAVPITSNAWAEWRGASFIINAADIMNGQVTVHHANNSQTDRTFRFMVIG